MIKDYVTFKNGRSSFGILGVLLFSVFLMPGRLYAQGADACSATQLTFTNNVASVIGSTSGLDYVSAAACSNDFYYPAAGVWYKLNGTGNPFIVNTCGSQFDTRVRVYTDVGQGCGLIFCDASNDNDDFCGIGSYESYASFSSNASRTYYILVDGQYFDEGDYVLNVIEDVPTPTCFVAVTQTPISGFCQGGVLLTASSSVAGSTFSWTLDTDPNFSATGESIVATSSGTYTALANGGDCDGESSGTVVSFTRENLLSFYTIIALREVHLHGNNTVLNGGVGAMNIDGKVKAHEGSLLTSATNFAKAPIFEINNGSVISNQITGVPAITLPSFLVQSFGTLEIEVPENGFYLATDSVYKKIKLRKNATVLFTQDNISIKEFQLDENTTVKFSGCANMYIDKKLDAKKGVSFNPDNFGVTVYVDNYGDDRVEFEEGSTYNGSIYATGELKAKGKEPKDGNPAIYTFMNGMFIADKVHGDKYVTWNWNTTCNNSCVATGSPMVNKTDETVEPTISLEFYAYPNPFSTTVKLSFNTSSISPIALEVYTLTGVLVEKHVNVEIDEVLELGNHLNAGMYIVRATQDGVTAYTRIIKN